ncbi:MAG: cellobiose-specific phosphotransferase system component IIC [Maritalea sp.]|jgi:cellobiose-specific phosphotransferase system component IIC
MRILLTIIVASFLLFAQSMLANANSRLDSTPAIASLVIEQSVGGECCSSEKTAHAKTNCVSDCTVGISGLVAAFCGQFNLAAECHNGELLRAIVLSLNAPPPITVSS